MPDLKEEAIIKWNALLHPGEKYILCPKVDGIKSIVGGCIPPEKHCGHTVELIESLTEMNTGWSQYIPDVLARCISCEERIRVNAQFLELKKEGKLMLEMEQVHDDERGGIYVISGMGKDAVINTTKAGFARGGCYHELNDEHFVVIEGSAMFRIGNETRFYSTGMSAFIPKGTPHMMVADTDCVTMEWGATRSEKNTYNIEMRALVEEINKERKHELQNKTG